MSALTFGNAFGAAITGVKEAAASRPVRGAYARIAVAMLLVTLALDAVGILMVLRLTDAPDAAAWYVSLGYGALRVVGVFLTFVAAPVVAAYLVNAIVPLFGEQIFLVALRQIDEERADRLEAEEGLGLREGVLNSLRRLFRFLVLSLLIFAGSLLVPILGPLLAPPATLFLALTCLGGELIEPYLSRRGLSYREQGKYLRAHRSAVLGFAAPVALLLAIPVAGPMLFGLSQAAAARLVVDVLAPEGDVEAGSPGPSGGDVEAEPQATA